MNWSVLIKAPAPRTSVNLGPLTSRMRTQLAPPSAMRPDAGVYDASMSTSSSCVQKGCATAERLCLRVWARARMTRRSAHPAAARGCATARFVCLRQAHGRGRVRCVDEHGPQPPCSPPPGAHPRAVHLLSHLLLERGHHHGLPAPAWAGAVRARACVCVRTQLHHAVGECAALCPPPHMPLSSNICTVRHSFKAMVCLEWPLH